ncbi:NhaC Na:H antiporter (NhaC) family protein [Phytophthora cinnamomi]|uniref:NhaC Na:H antiporter (NhaC) family protein n=1 Tax=Phytophthora cinnamomi TaxID=4785 RepID=UPI0035595A5C|nr:NhaC Na:H antiporter (NhaC) family protein [Phytophthora cinnamomi]
MGIQRLVELPLLAAALAGSLCGAHRAHSSSVSLQTPSVILQQVDFEASIELPELKNGSVYPRHLWYRVQDSDGAVLTNGSVKTLDADGNFRSQLSIAVKQLQLESFGQHNLTTTVWEEAPPKPEPTEAPRVDDTGASAVGEQVVLPPTVELDEVLLFQATHTTSVVVSPGWVSLIPPLVTLIMSAVLGQVTVSLLAGIWCGAIIVSNGDPFTAFLRTFDQYWVSAFTVDDHAGVLLFTIVLGGTIGVVQKGGGGHGLALLAKKFMTSSLRMQLSTWLLCLVIFFDDYSCILIVGSSLRQVLSQTGVSREKFAAIIHTVGVCLPSMSPVSAWIGVEIGYVAAQLRDLKLDWDPFVTCLSCLHYRFFPILFIAFIFITIICEKDFGPMVQFEKDAAASPINDGPMTPVFQGPMDSPKPELAALEPDTTKPLRWQNAVVPFLTIVVLTFVGMIFDGFNSLYTQDPNGSFGILDALSHCDSVSSLIRASAAGWVVAVALLLLQRIITLNEATKAWMEGVKDILDPTLILTLAWALGSVIGEVSTAPYIASVVGDSIPKQFLPAIACLLCYVVSFAVGSAFGTMAIMFPIIAPLSWSISGGDAENLRQCFGSILGGSVFGNTCSPIADTSILASLSAHVPLENHVRSILPYAVLVAVVSVAGGSLPIGLKICSTFTAFGICLAVLLLVVFFCGTRVNMRYRSLSSCSFLSVSPPSRYDGESQPLLSA